MLYTENFKAIEKKTKALSIKYYNLALPYVKEDKLIYALERLNKSVAYDKTNITAQNLIGLVLYRLGRITDCYIHWSISASIDNSEKNPAVTYLQDILNSVDFSEKSKAVSKYNESLNHAKQGNYDMAIMRLKRGLDFNPKSVDILNLLSFCLMMQGKNNAAYKYTERVLKIDKANPIAKNYQRILRPDRLSIFKKEDNDTNTYYNKTAANAINKVQKGKGNIIYFMAGIVVMAVIGIALVIPSVFKSYERSIGKYETDYAVLKNTTDTEMSKKDETIKNLTEENESLKSKLDSAGAKALQERVKTLAEIENNFKNDNIEVAADRLVALDITGFTGEVLDQYRKLCDSVLVAAAEEYFTKGQEFQNSEEYDEAIEMYNKCIQCSQNGGDTGYSAMYELGRIYIEKGDNASAAKFFTTVAEKHPVEAIRNEAATFLNNYYNA
ncbi:MAG: tetratricopeptide repeat protein [Lachnospirales bacterium]